MTSPIINFFLYEGVPLETIRLILLLPIIATLIAVLRQVVGIKAFGVYTPLIVTFAFLAMNGIKYSVFIFLAVIFTGVAMRFILRPFRLLYLPRVSVTLTVVAVVILGTLALGGSLKRTGLASVSIFPILIMIILVEKFVTVQIEKGNKTAFFLALETLVISIIGYYLASWQTFIQFIMAYPWVIIFTIPINIILGRWTGLRITEYYRFREVIKNL